MARLLLGAQVVVGRLPLDVAKGLKKEVERLVKTRVRAEQLPVGFKVKLVEDDPDPILIRQYNKVNDVLDAIANDFDGGSWGDAYTAQEVLNDVKRMQADSEKLEKLLVRLRAAIGDLHDAATVFKLKK